MSELGGFFPFYLGDVWSMQPRTSGGPTPIQSITISITFNNTSALPFSVKQPTASKAQAKVTVDAGVSQEIRWNDERYYANNTQLEYVTAAGVVYTITLLDWTANSDAAVGANLQSAIRTIPGFATATATFVRATAIPRDGFGAALTPAVLKNISFPKLLGFY